MQLLHDGRFGTQIRQKHACGSWHVWRHLGELRDRLALLLREIMCTGFQHCAAANRCRVIGLP